jgi:DNA polymerase III epsilon subunit-like protein
MATKPLILVFDTETTGLPPRGESSVSASSDLEKWPIIVQLAFFLYDPDSMEIVGQSEEGNDVVKLREEQFPIPQGSIDVHGVTDERSRTEGRPIDVVMDEFIDAYDRTSSLVAHNAPYDINVVCAELLRLINSADIDEARKAKYNDAYKKMRGLDPDSAPEIVDTINLSKNICNIWPYKYVRDAAGNVIVDKITAEDGKQYEVKRKEYFQKAYSPKGPNLEEAHIALFNEQINGRTHSALVDVAACLRVYMQTDPRYNKNICAPENNTPSNAEICRIINPGPAFAFKVSRRIGSKQPAAADSASVAVAAAPPLTQEQRELIARNKAAALERLRLTRLGANPDAPSGGKKNKSKRKTMKKINKNKRSKKHRKNKKTRLTRKY